MATRLLVVADTHVPKRARILPAQVWSEVESADLVVHAGDWVDEGLLDEFEVARPPTRGRVGQQRPRWVP